MRAASSRNASAGARVSRWLIWKYTVTLAPLAATFKELNRLNTGANAISLPKSLRNAACDNVPVQLSCIGPTRAISMNSFRRNMTCFFVLLVPTAGMFVSGCTTTTSQSFNVAKNPDMEAAFVAADADFSKYDRLLAEDMGIFFPSDAAPSFEDQQRTRQIFREAFLGELGGYVIVREPSPTTLQVQATLIDYRNATGADVPNVRRALRDVARPGALLFLMELKDPESGKILARAADSASAPSFSTSPDTVTDWSAVEASAGRWAKLFRNFLDENLSK